VVIIRGREKRNKYDNPLRGEDSKSPKRMARDEKKGGRFKSPGSWERVAKERKRNVQVKKLIAKIEKNGGRKDRCVLGVRKPQGEYPLKWTTSGR